MRRAKAMRPNMAASPPNKYGTGECHGECCCVPMLPIGDLAVSFMLNGSLAAAIAFFDCEFVRMRKKKKKKKKKEEKQRKVG